jgi:hypothetical protein
MMTQSTLPKDDHELTIKRIIARLCEERGIEVTFMTNRRHSDVATCVLSGLRDLVLPMPMLLLETLETQDIEVVRSKQEGLAYLLHLVITKRLEEQYTQIPERRAKLRKR